MKAENRMSENWLRELELFLKTDSKLPPLELTNQVTSVIDGELNPPLGQVVTKMAAIHLVAALSVLAVCPQLGVGPLFSSGHGLMMTFMEFGPLVCAASCGALFLGTSFLLSALVLTRPELKVAHRYRWREAAGLAALSLGAFMLAGSHREGFALLAAWSLGSVISGWTAMTLVASIRLRSLRSL